MITAEEIKQKRIELAIYKMNALERKLGENFEDMKPHFESKIEQIRIEEPTLNFVKRFRDKLNRTIGDLQDSDDILLPEDAQGIKASAKQILGDIEEYLA